ncbi:hypothetical protein ACP4OV_014412 [Aristida adscensionis]
MLPVSSNCKLVDHHHISADLVGGKVTRIGLFWLE